MPTATILMERILAMTPHDFIETVKKASKPHSVSDTHTWRAFSTHFHARFLTFPHVSSR